MVVFWEYLKYNIKETNFEIVFEKIISKPSLKLVSLTIKMMFNVFLPLLLMFFKHLMKCIISAYKQYKIIFAWNVKIHKPCSDMVSLYLNFFIGNRNKLSINEFLKYFHVKYLELSFISWAHIFIFLNNAPDSLFTLLPFRRIWIHILLSLKRIVNSRSSVLFSLYF